MPVSLLVNGTKYEGWKKVRITPSMEALSGGFEVEVSERWPGRAINWEINPGDACLVRIDSDTVITGWVDEVDSEIDKDSHTLTVRGRDKAGDLVDCSAIYGTGQFSGQRMPDIVQKLVAPFGIPVRFEGDVGPAFKKFNIQPGESVYECIERMAKMRALLVLSDGLGNLVITRAGSNQAAAAIIEGENFLKGNSNKTHADRFSEYIVKGQDQGDDNTPAAIFTGSFARVRDNGIKRYRPQLIIAEDKATTKNCADRAAWARSVRIGKALSANVEVVGWRQGKAINSPLWRINSITRATIPTLKVNERMLISEVTYSLDPGNGGSITAMKLVRPDAYKLIAEKETE